MTGLSGFGDHRRGELTHIGLRCGLDIGNLQLSTAVVHLSYGHLGVIHDVIVAVRDVINVQLGRLPGLWPGGAVWTDPAAGQSGLGGEGGAGRDADTRLHPGALRSAPLSGARSSCRSLTSRPLSPAYDQEDPEVAAADGEGRQHEGEDEQEVLGRGAVGVGQDGAAADGRVQAEVAPAAGQGRRQEYQHAQPDGGDHERQDLRPVHPGQQTAGGTVCQ